MLIADLWIRSAQLSDCRVLLTFQVFDNKVIRSQDLHLWSLLPWDHLWHLEVLEVLMFRLYKHLIIHSLMGVMPFIHSLQDGQELQIIHVVVPFGTLASLRAVVDKPDKLEPVILDENTGNQDATCISLQNHRLNCLEMLQDGCIHYGTVELPESDFGIRSAIPFDLIQCPGILCFVYWVWYWHCHLCIVSEDPLVDSGELNKRLHFPNRLQGWPTPTHWSAVGFHANPVGAMEKYMKPDLWDSKTALCSPAIETKLL